MILRALVAVGGERDRPAGKSEHTDRVSDLLRGESECCCRNRSGLLRRESEWCWKEKTETSNNNVRLRCEKKGDPRWQSKETSPLPIQQQSVTDLNCPLLIGH
jgi:ribosome assembly protein YihI (activator of Der GTPase)